MINQSASSSVSNIYQGVKIMRPPKSLRFVNKRNTQDNRKHDPYDSKISSFAEINLQFPIIVYLLASGPNGKAHYSKIPEGAFVIAVNRAAAIPFDVPGIKFRVNSWIVADYKVTNEKYFKEIYKYFQGRRIFSDAVIKSLNNVTYSNNGNGIIRFPLSGGNFNINVYRNDAQKIFMNGTVSSCALRIAQLCGAKEVILCGVDMSGNCDYAGALKKDSRHGDEWGARRLLDAQIKWQISQGMRILSLSETKLQIPYSPSKGTSPTGYLNIEECNSNRNNTNLMNKELRKSIALYNIRKVRNLGASKVEKTKNLPLLKGNQLSTNIIGIDSFTDRILKPRKLNRFQGLRNRTQPAMAN